jgi:hypothetical protein
MITATVNRQCSRCGSRTKTEGCPRCLERELAHRGGEAEVLRFEQDEDEQLSRIDRPMSWDESPASPLPISVALVGSGIPLTVALIACGKKKLATNERVAARDLYVGTLYRMAIRYAVATADDYHILSALHGLVHPYELLAPYDFTMTQMLMSQQVLWGKSIVSALKAAYPLRRLHIVFYAGQQYIQPILHAMANDDCDYWTVEDPLQGLGIGQRLSWFKVREPLVILHEGGDPLA